MDGRRWHATILGMIAAIGVVAVLFFATPARAQNSDKSVTIGSVYQMEITGCVKMSSAVDILDAEKWSHEHAVKVYVAQEDCDTQRVTFRVGPIVHTVTSPEGINLRVVEISPPQDPKVTAYWLTSMQIVASVTKPGVARQT